MAQIHVMSDDDGEVTALLDALMPLLRATPRSWRATSPH